MSKEEKTIQEQFKSFEPKRNNRFMVEFEKPFDIKPYVVKYAERPKYYFKNNKIEYDEMVMEFNDPISPSTASELMEGIRANSVAKNSQEIKFKLKMLDPVGDVVEEWDITGELVMIDFDNLDYEDDSPTTIVMILDIIDVMLLY